MIPSIEMICSLVMSFFFLSKASLYFNGPLFSVSFQTFFSSSFPQCVRLPFNFPPFLIGPHILFVYYVLPCSCFCFCYTTVHLPCVLCHLILWCLMVMFPGRCGCCLLILLNVPVVVSTGIIVIVGCSVSDAQDSESAPNITPLDPHPIIPVTCPEPPQQEPEESPRDDGEEQEEKKVEEEEDTKEDEEEEREEEEEEEDEKGASVSVTRRESHDFGHAQDKPSSPIPESSSAHLRTHTQKQQLNQTTATDSRC